MIKLIVGLFHPQFGTITVGGVPITETNADAWMRNCSVVMQDGIIFSGSILSNIALSDENPDIERVNESLHIACLDEYISTLPMGLMTRIGNEGIDISGGQKQRLLIARAVYRKTDLLVLDEATSSLDAENEARVVRNINSYKDGRTVIIAAHRLSTVKNADFIIFMRNGAIEEIGNHNELLSARRGYYSLVSNQLELAI